MYFWYKNYLFFTDNLSQKFILTDINKNNYYSYSKKITIIVLIKNKFITIIVIFITTLTLFFLRLHFFFFLVK
jgi:hypothetical protein